MLTIKYSKFTNKTKPTQLKHNSRPYFPMYRQ